MLKETSFPTIHAYPSHEIINVIEKEKIHPKDRGLSFVISKPLDCVYKELQWNIDTTILCVQWKQLPKEMNQHIFSLLGYHFEMDKTPVLINAFHLMVSQWILLSKKNSSLFINERELQKKRILLIVEKLGEKGKELVLPW